MLNKPTFGAVPSENTDIQERRKQRPEIGAIWENTTKDQNTYMNIRFKLPKSELMKLIDDSNTDTEGNVTVGFVAFPNKRQEGNTRRPSFRIYQELSGGQAPSSGTTTQE